MKYGRTEEIFEKLKKLKIGPKNIPKSMRKMISGILKTLKSITPIKPKKIITDEMIKSHITALITLLIN